MGMGSLFGAAGKAMKSQVKSNFSSKGEGFKSLMRGAAGASGASLPPRKKKKMPFNEKPA